MRLRLVAGVLTALSLLAGCGAGPRVDYVGAPAGVPPAATAAPPTDRDGTDTIDEFQRDVQGATTLAQRYWEQRFAAQGVSFRPVRTVVPYRRDGEITCAGQPLGRNNAAYCAAGDFIAYDVEWAFGEFRRLGDTFLFYLIGHEYAHAVQIRLREQARFTIQQELQADCLAGAYIGDSVRGRRLTLQPGDLEELRAGLAAVADAPDQPWFAEGAHGSVSQRTTAFTNGFRGSVPECGLR
jgi:hypothetical protein